MAQIISGDIVQMPDGARALVFSLYGNNVVYVRENAFSTAIFEDLSAFQEIKVLGNIYACYTGIDGRLQCGHTAIK